MNEPGLLKSFRVDALEVRVFARAEDLARAAARLAQEHFRAVLAANGEARVILATGNSQLKFLDSLIGLGGVDWSKVACFHMDEYLGISADHPASFRRYLRERVEGKLKPKTFHYLQGDAWEPAKECNRYAALLDEEPIDLCCLGIGENGHLAFNDPPVADFDDGERVKVVKLEDDCKRQQANEGHFPDVESVPPYALTLTIPALCSARRIICIAPEERKARAVKAALHGSISPVCPASILRRQPQATLFLDADSAGLL